MILKLIKDSREVYSVWACLQDTETPSEESETFIIGTSNNKYEAIIMACSELERAVAELRKQVYGSL